MVVIVGDSFINSFPIPLHTIITIVQILISVVSKECNYYLAEI